MNNKTLIFTIIFFAVMLAACGGEAAANPEIGVEAAVDPQSGSEPTIEPQAEEEAAVDPKEKGDPERGRAIFETGGEKYPENGHFCIGCHSLDGSEGKYGPSMKGISERAGERVPGLTAEAYLRQSILEPNATIVGDYPNKMGAIHAALLSYEEIEDLVAFMLTQ